MEDYYWTSVPGSVYYCCLWCMFRIPLSDCNRYNFSTIFSDLDQDEINAKAEAFEGSQSNVCIRLQRMLDDGRYEDVRDEIGRLRKTAAFKNTDSCYWEYRLSVWE